MAKKKFSEAELKNEFVKMHDLLEPTLVKFEAQLTCLKESHIAMCKAKMT